MAVCCVRAGAAGPREATGPRCRVSGRTTNCRPRRAQTRPRSCASSKTSSAAWAASTRSGSSETGPDDRSRCTSSPTRASPRSRSCATCEPSRRRCSASSSTTASCRSRSSTRTKRTRRSASSSPVGVPRPRRVHQRRGRRACARRCASSSSTTTASTPGYAEGSVASAARPQLVAAAALDAVRQAEPAAEAIHITSAEISRVGPNRVAVVTVVYVDPPTRARRLGIRGRAPRPRRRGRTCTARCHEPSARTRRTRTHAPADPSSPRTIRASLGAVPPVAVQLSYRLGGADGVAVEARKWEWALHELGFDVRRVAGELDDGLRPDDTWLPFLAIDPVDDAHAGPGRARGRDRGCRPRHRREPLLAPDQPRRSAMTAAVLADARRARRVPPPRPPVATRGTSHAAGHPAAPRQLAARDHQRPFARAAREPRLRRGDAPQRVRPRAAPR